MSAQDSQGFQRLSRLLRGLTGIHLPPTDKNHSLMASRLATVLRSRQLDDYGQYADLLESGDRGAQREFICQLTTNTTNFFREDGHFALLRERLPSLLAEKARRGSRELRIWCSPCSTGQEAYSLAITALEAIEGLPPVDIKILATDIDSTALERAKAGEYSRDEAESLPPLFRMKYFEQASGANRAFRARPELRRLIRFAELNLLAEPYPFQFPFDVIFCRNVLIYFDRVTAEAVVQRLGRALASGGYLFLGHSETGAARLQSLKGVGPAVYQRCG